MDYIRDLNEEQYLGVSDTSQYIKVIAGAGSGKTRVLTYRIAYLIEHEHVYPSQILGITFTNKAAKEIKERVNNLVDGANNMALSTIHSWCARFLRNYADYINYQKNFTILDEEDQVQVMKNIFVSHGLQKNDKNIKECLNWIGSKKCDGYQYKDLEHEHYPNPLINQFLIYFKEYTEVLRKTNSLDFDDLMLKTIDILKDEQNGVAASMHKRIKHILVDEFQDINDVQFHLITLLMNEDTNLYVVGDPDQTIYTWRGANNKIMLELEDKLNYVFKGAKVKTIILRNNYRSSKNILTSANLLIANNIERIKKDLLPVNGEGEEISFYNARTSSEEASFIASTIDEKVRKENYKYNSFAVLYRSNYLTRELEGQMNLHQIPYKIFGGQKFYQRREIKDVLAYLSLITNPLADTALERIINVPKRNIGPTSIELLKKGASSASQSLYFYIKENISETSLPLSKKNQLKNLIDLIETYKTEINMALNKDYGEIIEKMIDKLGYFAYLREEDDGDDRVDNVNELIGTIKEFFKVNQNSLFEDFITNATLQASGDEVNDGDYVSLMTVHTAKGLEFDNVFIYSLNEGVFPSKRAVEESKRGEEEERRLAYVAITRARKKLYLTCNQDFSHVLGTNLRPSRFLKEAGIKVKTPLFSDYEEVKTYINPLYKNANLLKTQPKKEVVAQPVQSNGVTDWKVNDKLIHDQYGIGTVIEVISNKLIKIKFDDPQYGEKTMLSTHIKIKRLLS